MVLPVIMILVWGGGCLVAEKAEHKDIAAGGNVTAKELRCEYRTSPLGIDIPNPHLSWVLDSDQRCQKQTAYQILVSSSEETLKQNKADLWDSAKVESDQSIHAVYAGKKLTSQMQCFWKVRVWDKDSKVSAWSEPAMWKMSPLKNETWNASWICDGRPAPDRDEDFYKEIPNPLLRKQFSITKLVKHAFLNISGLGYYEAFLNGKRIGDYVLDPGWTSYKKRVLYSTYDVTGLLQQGQNAIGVMLGNGWYNPLPLRLFGRWNLRQILNIGQPKLIAQLNIEYADGSRQSVVTDKSWKAGQGPILKNNVYLGELYDARCEQPGWDKRGFDDSSWKPAVIAPAPPGELRAQMQPPIRITKVIKAVNLTEPRPGTYIFDLGQNFAGWIRLHVNGPAGTMVKLRYGELLNKDGSLNGLTTVACQIKEKSSNGGPGAPKTAWQEDAYILKGGGDETYSQHFIFHGFRYVEVIGYPGKPTLDSLEGLRLNADLPSAGTFECSNEMFNRIQQMVQWTFLSNVFSIESDCPGREKFGYGGDMVTAGEAYIYNYDMSNFYAKAVRDFADDVRSNGGMPECAPYNAIDSDGFGGGTGPIGWQLAYPFLQMQLYRYYGDRRTIEEQYKTSLRQLEFLRSKAKDNTIARCISDHAGIDPKPVTLTATAFYYHHAQLFAEFAKILGHNTDARRAEALANNIKEAFIKKFLKPGTGQFDTHTQACQAFALYYDLIPPQERKAALDVLAGEILDRHSGHLSTGIFGTKMMLDVLRLYDRPDLAYAIVNQKTAPGWGFMLENDATTLWEQWNGGGASYNHPMFGSVSEWFFKSLAGITPDPNAMGFDKIIIRPQITGDLVWVKANYNSVRGKITVNWKLDGRALTLGVVIPSGTAALVYVPTKDARSIVEGGQSVTQAEGVKFLRMEAGAAVFQVASGKYGFTSQFK